MNKLTFLHRSTLPLTIKRAHSQICPQKPALKRPRQLIAATTSQPHPVQTQPLDRYLSAGLGVVILKRGKARLFRDNRNPMVYAGAVQTHVPPHGRTLRDGDPVIVCDGAYSCVGLGFYNSKSMFRVRLLRHVDAVPALPWLFQRDIESRLRNALGVRRALGLPNGATNVYRVVNGEGDRLSGLVVDRVADKLVVSSSALWCEVYREDIVRGLEVVLPECAEVVWRRNLDRLRQDGLVEQDGADGEEEDCDDGEEVVHEAGVKYALSRFALTKGQKTGHYADQRENRVFLRELLRQRDSTTRVLDLFCYSGGFAINAALGNPLVEVVAVDSSGRALDMARRNAALNGVSERVEFVQGDVVKYLKGLDESERESFDVVVVDPPKFAPSAKALPRATHKYRSLNLAAMKMVKRGGVLCTCTCSAAMTQDRRLFVEIVRSAAAELGRELSVLKVGGGGGSSGYAGNFGGGVFDYGGVCVSLVGIAFWSRFWRRMQKDDALRRRANLRFWRLAGGWRW